MTHRRDFIKAGVAGLAFGVGANQIAQATNLLLPRLNLMTTGNPYLDKAIGGGIYPGITIISGYHNRQRFKFIRNIVDTNWKYPEYKNRIAHIYEDVPDYDSEFGRWYLKMIFSKNDYCIVETIPNLTYLYPCAPDWLARKANLVLSTMEGDKVKILKTRYGDGIGNSYPLDVL